MKNPLMRLIIVITFLSGAGLACNFPGSSAAATLPPTAQPMTTEQIQNLENQIQSTLANPSSSGDLTITITQEQLNAIIASQISQQPDQVISDPSVVLTGGHMEVYGVVSKSGISADMKMVLQPEVDASGNPKLRILSMTLAGLPVPDALKTRVATMMDNALSNYLGSNQNKFKVKTITITEGQMAITGTPQKQ